ncbi:MAG: DUF4914 family protein [Spirochaetia bacterium]
MSVNLTNTNAAEKLVLSPEVEKVLRNCGDIFMPETRGDLIEKALDGKDKFTVSYEVPGMGEIAEADVIRCRNGAAINYREPYMRRRDPECMVIADQGPTDKTRYSDRFGTEFGPMRDETFQWLAQQDLILIPFMAGGEAYGYPALLIAPGNAGFFAGGLADLQGRIPASQLPNNFKPRSIIFVAPPFRHTRFDGKQVVVHNRTEEVHEIFSYNLYPGPSAKKGMYGLLLTLGEKEGWTTLHGSTVKVVTPFDHELTIMHEGASGGGKSEMIEQVHREPDGRLLMGQNLVTEDRFYIDLPDACKLYPVTDDMALCHPKFQNNSGKLVVSDAEQGWFLRVNHITNYGTDPHYEKLCIHPPEPLIFLNLHGAVDASCLLWEHTMDAPDKPCPNPRVVMPRRFVPDTVNSPVQLDIRSFGIRVPPCTTEKPSYGIIGLFHILPPALAWLWRLVSPRGHGNPSITDTEGMTSEGVGSYWPFATGRMVDQANLLLQQVIDTPNVRYKLIPNQHIGAYSVGFMPQWIARDFLARRGSVRFTKDQISESRCSLLGYFPKNVAIGGTSIPKGMLQVDLQPEVGVEAYEAGAQMLVNFFRKQLEKFVSPELHETGRKIIECCMDGGSINEYEALLPSAE